MTFVGLDLHKHYINLSRNQKTMTQVFRLALAGLLGVQGCRAAKPSKVADTPAASSQEDTSAGLRSPRGEIDVDRPTLVSAFVAAQQQIDSVQDLSDVLDDYQFYLSKAIPILERGGVRVAVTNDSIVRWHDQLGHHFISAADSGGILYLFLRPDGGVRSLRNGVELDEAILSAARQHFGLPLAQNDSMSR